MKDMGNFGEIGHVLIGKVASAQGTLALGKSRAKNTRTVQLGFA